MTREIVVNEYEFASIIGAIRLSLEDLMVTGYYYTSLGHYELNAMCRTIVSEMKNLSKVDRK